MFNTHQSLYTVTEAAELLRVEPSTINAYLRSGRLSSYRISRRHRLISGDQLNAFLDQVETNIPVEQASPPMVKLPPRKEVKPAKESSTCRSDLLKEMRSWR